MSSLDDALIAVDDLFDTRIEAANKRKAERAAEIELEEETRVRQERERFQKKEAREKGEKERRTKKASEEFALSEEELRNALKTLVARLERDREATVEDTELSREESLEDVVNNAMDRGIFRSGIREEGEEDVNERADELIERAEEGYLAEVESGESETELAKRRAEATRDLEIEDAAADYDELLAQLQHERDVAIENADMEGAAKMSALINNTADQIAQLEDERALRKKSVEDREAAKQRELAAQKKAGTGGASGGGGGGASSGGGGGGGYQAGPGGYARTAAAVSGMKPIVIPKNIMTRHTRTAGPRRGSGGYRAPRATSSRTDTRRRVV